MFCRRLHFLAASRAAGWVSGSLLLVAFFPVTSAQANGDTPSAPILPGLPAPTEDPLRIDFHADPILRLSESSIPVDDFRAVVAQAVARHPARFEAIAGDEEARAALAEARERRFPSGDLTITSYKVLTREFSDDPLNILERSRPANRTDALLNIQQTLLDFGATSRRIEAAGARLRAASAELELTADQLALRTIASWYDVVAYQALVAVSEEFAAAQSTFREAIDERIRQGVSAEGDLARVESYIASANTRLASLRRASAQAEARFAELTGVEPLPVQPRAPQLATAAMDKETAVLEARSRPDVRAAEAAAEAARYDYRAVRSELLPTVTGGIDAGRYGVFENETDYDVRARVTLRYRFYGGIQPRAEQVGARARGAEARAQRVKIEAERDAAIAWSDVQALDTQFAAMRENYVASRRSRDVVVERFKVSRGTVLDVLEVNEAYFATAVAYVEAMSELDAARYVLLSRTGKLLEVLDIEPESAGGVE